MTMPIQNPRKNKRKHGGPTKKVFAGHIYELAPMPADVAQTHEDNLRQYGKCTTKTNSIDGHHYMVQDGQAWRATDERIFPPVRWRDK